MRKAILEGTGYVYWLDGASIRNHEAGAETRFYDEKKDQIYARRYVCGDCVDRVFGDFAD